MPASLYRRSSDVSLTLLTRGSIGMRMRKRICWGGLRGLGRRWERPYKPNRTESPHSKRNSPSKKYSLVEPRASRMRYLLGLWKFPRL